MKWTIVFTAIKKVVMLVVKGITAVVKTYNLGRAVKEAFDDGILSEEETVQLARKAYETGKSYKELYDEVRGLDIPW